MVAWSFDTTQRLKNCSCNAASTAKDFVTPTTCLWWRKGNVPARGRRDIGGVGGCSWAVAADFEAAQGKWRAEAKIGTGRGRSATQGRCSTQAHGPIQGTTQLPRGGATQGFGPKAVPCARSCRRAPGAAARQPPRRRRPFWGLWPSPLPCPCLCPSPPFSAAAGEGTQASSLRGDATSVRPESWSLKKTTETRHHATRKRRRS